MMALAQYSRRAVYVESSSAEPIRGKMHLQASLLCIPETLRVQLSGQEISPGRHPQEPINCFLQHLLHALLLL